MTQFLCMYYFSNCVISNALRVILYLFLPSEPMYPRNEIDVWFTAFFVFETSHEFMVLFVLRKLNLQTRMLSRPVGIDVWFLVGSFFYFHTLSCANSKGSPAGRLVISTIISWAGSFFPPEISAYHAKHVDRDQRPCPAESNLGLHCLPRH